MARKMAAATLPAFASLNRLRRTDTRPLAVTTQTNNCNCFSAGAQRPNVLSDPNLPADQRSVRAWFNGAAFAQPAAYTFGNAGVGIVRGPGLVNLDFSVLRNFQSEVRCGSIAARWTFSQPRRNKLAWQ